MFHLLITWFLYAFSFMMVSWLLPGFRIKNFGTALIASAIYGVLNKVLYGVLYKIFLILSLPMVILSFGLFAFVLIFIVDAILLTITDKILDDFEIDGLANTLIAALLLSFFTSLFGWIFL